MTIQRLTTWFMKRKSGTNYAYDFFCEAGKRVPWASTMWRHHLQSSHAFTIWLLAHCQLPICEPNATTWRIDDIPFVASKRKRKSICSSYISQCISYGGGLDTGFRCDRRLTSYKRILSTFKLYYREINRLVRA